MDGRIIAITIDVEDWYQVENLKRWLPEETWGIQPSRVEFNTRRVLDLFESSSQKVESTFFILGQLAKKHPHLVKEIAKRGHEVASHGYSHQLCSSMSNQDLYQDLDYSRKLLQDISGQTVKGYRAPSFSISERVITMLKSCGYSYDSSYNNFKIHGRYGKLEYTKFQKKGAALILEGTFYELPISNLEIAGSTIPWGGGGYFRLIPFGIYKIGMNRNLRKDGVHIFYFHPWEIDPHQPKIKEATGFTAWRHYTGLDKTYPRLRRMLEYYGNCEFMSCHSYLDRLNVTSKSEDNLIHLN